MNQEQKIFKRGSTTFFLSSLFFPRSIKKDVFDLYSFVRVADDYVDRLPAPDTNSFHNLRRLWTNAAVNPGFDTAKLTTDTLDERVTKNMIRVSRKHNFEVVWVESFLDAMQSDLTHKPYQTIDDTLHYVFGSGEVIGLMMARIMELKPEAADAAQLQGRALQFMNFIRDVQEDNDLHRSYFPANELKQFSLPDLTYQTATKQTKDFTKFIQLQLGRYETWQREAYTGYKYIPKRLRIPLQTAVDMYSWTAQEIRKNPLVIYEKKVKPSKRRILISALTNIG